MDTGEKIVFIFNKVFLYCIAEKSANGKKIPRLNFLAIKGSSKGKYPRKSLKNICNTEAATAGIL